VPLCAVRLGRAGSFDSVVMSTRTALFGGPVFFVLWFLGAQVLFFASGGGVNGESVPNADEYSEAVLSNQSGINSGSTLLVLAAVSLLWFAVGLRTRTKPDDTLGLFPVLAMGGVAVLLILQAGFVMGSLQIAEQAPQTSWHLHELSGILGFESYITSLLGGFALTALGANSRSVISKGFWWLTVVFAGILTLGGLLEGLGATTTGRFAILFGLWAFIAGFVLQKGLAEAID
jgi:hypothetical protein